MHQQEVVTKAASAHYAYSLLLCGMLGCSDSAIIARLCTTACGPGTTGCAAIGCAQDASASCDAAGCIEDKTTDACTSDSCVPDASSPDAALCSSGPYELTRKRLDLLMVVDDAASIYPWWSYLRDGLIQFLQDPESSGLGVGLQSFSQNQGCDPQQDNAPIVPIAPLPGNAAKLAQALPLTPTATTSTIPPLAAALKNARDWTTAHNDAAVGLVLLTDATPGQCDALTGDYDQEAARVARSGYQGTPSIQTHVVGFGALQTLGAIAHATGTEPASINMIPASAEQVAAALRQVRDDARPCAFAWPSRTMLASDSAVVLTESNGSERRYELARDRSICDRLDGFYVEDQNAPYPLVACPHTCARIGLGTRLALTNACMTR